MSTMQIKRRGYVRRSRKADGCDSHRHQVHNQLQSWTSRPGQNCKRSLKKAVPFAGLTPHAQIANFNGNGAKSMHTSVNASLKKLQTDYIDLLYVHWWDFSASIPELMQSLNHLVARGQVLYLGVSDTPAWVVSKANQYARDHGLRQFCVYQGRWSAASRDFEREIIPMCRDEGMGLAPWGALGSGTFKSEEERKKAEGRAAAASEDQIKTSRVLEQIAKKKGTLITSVALAYVMHKTPYVFPIVGGRKVEHLKGNIEALTLRLTKEDMEAIEGAAPFDPGFPNSFLYLVSFDFAVVDCREDLLLT